LKNLLNGCSCIVRQQGASWKGAFALATNGQFDGETANDAAALAAGPEGRNLKRRQALEEIRADIIAHRGSLDGLLDEFLAERREEARREMEGG
jgi:hypothetical protein